MALGFYGRKLVKYWNGSSWSESQYFGKIKMWDGSQWRTVEMQVAQDIAVSFSPDGGTSAGAPVYLADYAYYPSSAMVTVSCSATATWTWSFSGSSPYSSVASGGSGTSIMFMLDSASGSYYQSNITLSGNAGGITRYWTINLEADGYA
jgi:hypothetical protein